MKRLFIFTSILAAIYLLSQTPMVRAWYNTSEPTQLEQKQWQALQQQITRLQQQQTQLANQLEQIKSKSSALVASNEAQQAPNSKEPKTVSLAQEAAKQEAVKEVTLSPETQYQAQLADVIDRMEMASLKFMQAK